MKFPSLIRGPVKMLWILSVITFSFPRLSLAVPSGPGGPGAPKPPEIIRVPHIPADGFAYLVQTTPVRQDVYLARLRSAKPSSPIASKVGLLESYVSDDYNQSTVNSMKASLANDRLIVMSTAQGFEILDLNVEFFDMQTGAHQGFFNEESFAQFNSSFQPSQRLAEAKVQHVAEGRATQEEADAFDYSLVVPPMTSQGPFNVYAQWNNDGTASIFCDTEVFLANASGSTGEDIGTETFAINVSYSPVAKKMEIVDYGLKHTAATYPNVFKFSPKEDKNSCILFQGTPILFQDFVLLHDPSWVGVNHFFGYYQLADIVEAEIPAIYWPSDIRIE